MPVFSFQKLYAAIKIPPFAQMSKKQSYLSKKYTTCQKVFKDKLDKEDEIPPDLWYMYMRMLLSSLVRNLISGLQV